MIVWQIRYLTNESMQANTDHEKERNAGKFHLVWNGSSNCSCSLRWHNFADLGIFEKERWPIYERQFEAPPHSPALSTCH
jgi:hypothetical protein